MASNMNKKACFSPNLGQKSTNPPVNEKLSKQKSCQKWKLKKRSNLSLYNTLDSKLNQTTQSLQMKSEVINKNMSSFRRRNANNTPKVSNYSEDLNTMLESYFTKQIKQIKANLVELHRKESKLTINNKGDNKIKPYYLSKPKKATDTKTPVTIMKKRMLSENFDSNNDKKEIFHPEKRKQSSEKRKEGLSTSETRDNPKKVIQVKQLVHEKVKGMHSNNKEKKKLEVVKERKEKSEQLNKENKNDKVNGIKIEYYSNNNCAHRVFIKANDLDNFKLINKKFKGLFAVVYRKEIDVQITPINSININRETPPQSKSTEDKETNTSTIDIRHNRSNQHLDIADDKKSNEVESLNHIKTSNSILIKNIKRNCDMGNIETEKIDIKQDYKTRISGRNGHKIKLKVINTQCSILENEDFKHNKYIQSYTNSHNSSIIEREIGTHSGIRQGINSSSTPDLKDYTNKIANMSYNTYNGELNDIKGYHNMIE